VIDRALNATFARIFAEGIRMNRAFVKGKRRHGVAAVELAVLMIPLLILFLCVVELGRMIQVDQLVTNAAREGARMAAQGVNVQVIGDFVYVYTDQNSPPAPGTSHTSTNSVYVKDIVSTYLITCGITNVNNIVVEFSFLQAPGFTTDDTTRTDPWQGQRGDMFRIKVTLPYDNFRWTQIGWFNVQSVSEQVKWGMLADAPFTVNTAIPNWNGTIPTGAKQWYGNGGSGL
jgi:hypothetical protein